MKLYRFHRTKTLSVSTEEAWHFFSSPLNLPSIIPPKLHLAVSGEVPDTILPTFSTITVFSKCETSPQWLLIQGEQRFYMD